MNWRQNISEQVKYLPPSGCFSFSSSSGIIELIVVVVKSIVGEDSSAISSSVGVIIGSSSISYRSTYEILYNNNNFFTFGKMWWINSDKKNANTSKLGYAKKLYMLDY